MAGSCPSRSARLQRTGPSRADYDVLVVGAGPGGAVAARELALRGRHVALLEAKRLPRPKTCAGGISPWPVPALRRLGLWDRIAAEAYEIRGIRLGAPSGRETQWVGAASAVVLDRSRLDGSSPTRPSKRARRSGMAAPSPRSSSRAAGRAASGWRMTPASDRPG